MHVDLGCGKLKRGDIGIDISSATDADIICNLGFEDIPLEDEIATKVTAYDFIEHVPFVVWDNSQRKTPMIHLFNEVWRILKPGGVFEMFIPFYPNLEAFRDPTHCTFWTEETIDYFSGDYYGSLKESYGHTSNFKKISQEKQGPHLLIRIGK